MSFDRTGVIRLQRTPSRPGLFAGGSGNVFFSWQIEKPIITPFVVANFNSTVGMDCDAHPLSHHAGCQVSTRSVNPFSADKMARDIAVTVASGTDYVGSCLLRLKPADNDPIDQITIPLADDIDKQFLDLLVGGILNNQFVCGCLPDTPEENDTCE